MTSYQLYKLIRSLELELKYIVETVGKELPMYFSGKTFFSCPRSRNTLFNNQEINLVNLREGRINALEVLRKQVLQCKACERIVSTRTNIVFGTGNPLAELMFVGEAPGAEEDRQGEPFVGPAGQLLTKIIKAMGLDRSIVYITNVLKCRPDASSLTGNRKPSPSEIARCSPFLHQQISIIKPKVIVALGTTAVEGLLGRQAVEGGIQKIRGQWLEYNGIALMPTYHPSFILRNPTIQIKRQLWEDMLKVMERLGLPITVEQRNYFLKSKSS